MTTQSDIIKQAFDLLAESIKSETMSKADFIKAFESVIVKVKQIEDQNIKDFEALRKNIATLSQKVSNDATDNVDSLKKQLIDYVGNSMDKIMSDHQARMTVMDEKMDSLHDGQDADEDSVAQKVVKLIKIPTIDELANSIPTLGMQIRDALELLQGPDRLNIKAIDGLTEIIEELRKSAKNKVSGGGINYGAMMLHEVDGEVPVNSGDDINFLISKTPSPATSIKLFRNGFRQKIDVDYTYSNKILTLTTQLDPANEYLLVDYKI